MSTTTVTESGEPAGEPNQAIDKERRATIAVAAAVGGAGVSWARTSAATPAVASANTIRLIAFIELPIGCQQ